MISFISCRHSKYAFRLVAGFDQVSNPAIRLVTAASDLFAKQVGFGFLFERRQRDAGAGAADGVA